MAARKSPAAIAVSFLAAAALLLTQQPALAQSASDHPAYRTPSERAWTCLHADYQKLIRDDDIVGLFTWGRDCHDLYQNTHNPNAAERAGYAEIFAARYLYEHPRRSPYLDQRAIDYTARITNPEPALKDARLYLTQAQEQGVDVSDPMRLLEQAEQYVQTPLSFYKYDNSAGASCLLDGQPRENKEEMVNKIATCATAYNQRPLGILAFKYADAIYFLSKDVLLTQMLNNDMIVGGYIAKDFYGRAIREGYDVSPMMDLTDNMIDAYNDRMTGMRLFETLKIAVGAFAVGITLSAIAGAAAGGGTVFGGAAAEAAAPTADMTLFIQEQRAAIALVPK